MKLLVSVPNLAKLNVPVRHFWEAKSSLSVDGWLEFSFAEFEATLELSETVLSFELRLETTELVLLLELFWLASIFASARIMMIKPTPMIPTTAIPPKTHQTAFDFFAW